MKANMSQSSRFKTEQANVVRLIFSLYLSGYSIGGIIKELEKREIPSPTGKEQWYKLSIDRMLSNEKYVGDVLVGKTYTEDIQNQQGKTTRVKRNNTFQKTVIFL